MGAQKEHTFESTHMKAHILITHTKAQRRAYISEHSGEHTYEPAQPPSRGTSHKSHFVWKFIRKMPDPKPKRAILCGNLEDKCRTRIPPPAFIWKFTGKNAHGDVTRAILCCNLKEKCRTLFPGSTFCMEIYGKKRTWTMDISAEPFCVVIYRKNASHYSAHLD